MFSVLVKCQHLGVTARQCLCYLVAEVLDGTAAARVAVICSRRDQKVHSTHHTMCWELIYHHAAACGSGGRPLVCAKCLKENSATGLVEFSWSCTVQGKTSE
jgi:hypothetical protein